MSARLRSPRGKVAIGVAGGLLVVAAMWFLLVAPQRTKATELEAQVATSRAELSQRRIALARPSASVTVKPGDLYRLTKALPERDRHGRDSPRREPACAGRNELDVPLDHAVALRCSEPATCSSHSSVVVQGRFSNISRFLGDLRSLVSVRHGRLDARGRLYSVSQVDMGTPEGAKKFPVVQAKVTLNAFTFSAPVPTTTTPPSTPTDTSSSGTVAAGATP